MSKTVTAAWKLVSRGLPNSESHLAGMRFMGRAGMVR